MGIYLPMLLFWLFLGFKHPDFLCLIIRNLTTYPLGYVISRKSLDFLLL